MTNKQIANMFKLTGALMELHGENPFKTKSYNNAYISLRKVGDPLILMTKDQLEAIPGVGKAIADKILEIKSIGTFKLFEELKTKTPTGVIELLNIGGLGPKKVEIIWKIMGIEDPGALLYACSENRLVEFKGFGVKSQKTIQDKLQFYFTSQSKMLYPDAFHYVNELIFKLNNLNPEGYIFVGGEILRKEQIIEKIELIWISDLSLKIPEEFQLNINPDETFKLSAENQPDITIYNVTSKVTLDKYFKILTGNTYNSNIKYLPYSNYTLQNYIGKLIEDRNLHQFHSNIFLNNFPFENPEIWHNPELHVLEKKLIRQIDLKGLVHLHTTYSDGINTLEEMVEAAITRNFEYMVVTDHSKFAFYANGLSEERLLLQLEHIDQLNERFEGKIKILKGIECDILPDGSLDYSDNILQLLDVVIVSIHSHLNMDKDKATERIISAVRNPYSNILGHPSGRVMLSRNGYELDYDRVFEACKINNVHIELNASAQRLDLDFSLLNKAQIMGIKICINPDAHSISGIDNLSYGITAARKGGLLQENCLNTLTYDEFLNSFNKK